MPETRFANGNIAPGRFVILDSTTPGGKVIQASAATAPIFGVAQDPTRMPPYATLDDGFVAVAGETLLVYTFADKEAWVEVGVGGCNPGDRLTANASGQAIVTTTAGNFVGAFAKQKGLAGDLVPVDLMPSYGY
jgi:hypothetical protein